MTNKPWLDSTLPVENRVALLMEAMTTDEKIAQMVQISYSIVTPDEADEWARKGAGSFLHILGNNSRRIQRLATETRLGIPVIFGIDAIHGHAIHNGATVFPSQLALACSWSPELAEKMGEVTAREVAAEGLHWAFSPVFCLARDLRWGRVDETFGEDPFLAGKLGCAVVRGYQGDNPADDERIIACAKHYIAYGESTGGRDSYDSSVSMRTVRDIFLPPFAEAARAGCLTFMAGYEPIDRVPCSAHKKLLRDVLKDELGFSGFVVTDWSNLTSLIERHHLADNYEDGSRIAIEAGNDMIMTSPEFYEATRALIEKTAVDPTLIDDAVARILRVKFIAGLFDVPSKVKTLTLESDPDAKAAEAVFNCEAHQKINYESALASMVLLKNDEVGGKPALPVRGPASSGVPSVLPDGSARVVKTIAVIGPNADSVRAQFGDWTFFTHPVPHLDAIPELHVTTMLEGLQEAAAEQGVRVLYDKGCDIFDPAEETIGRACRLAKKADAVFVCVGDTLVQTGETHDRADLALSGAQDTLVEALSAVCAKRKTPLVSILVNGKPLEFERVVGASDAVFETFNSGTLGGRAAADILFGKAAPQGRLPVSFPRTTGQLPVYYNQIPGWHEGSYFDCESTPLFAFGEGITYTWFEYSDLRLSASTVSPEDTVQVSVTVTNTGACAATETVQLYATDHVASIVTPVRELKGFTKVHLERGETKTVTIDLPVESLAIITPDEKRVVEPGTFSIQVGHDSRPDSLLSTVLTVQ